MPLMLMGDEKNNNNDVDLILSSSLLDDETEDTRKVSKNAKNIAVEESFYEPVREIKAAIKSDDDARLISALVSFVDAYVDAKNLEYEQEDED